MPDRSRQHEERLSRFVTRVWQSDIEPLLRGRLAKQRAATAKAGGAAAAAGGAVLDGIFKLRGKPFTRAFTVLGSTFGAILPDAWDWNWLQQHADEEQRRVIDEQVRKCVNNLPEQEALDLFDLPASAPLEELRHAWRALSLRWHPDKAPDAARRREYELRFVAYKSAYELLVSAYEQGHLPRTGSA